ncbi:hypothetical protein [Epilithonimonas lactis]|uniref:YD repeat-containing protein n=1 Tax=Epilithonimonas lactis TaxID=421072 RepID=A0A085BM57_9FLAO|nr:hypothetical protein [Epilithonimonas lactis]KFC23552.1 hypothetical protein IO89_02935 [Epilithonimonas lactis]SEQ17271.1 hypothetical protein SAMN04488097_1552 [Epilithonimonas lactis]
MKNLFYYLSLIFGLLMLSSCDPNQDANGDLLVGMDYNPNTNPGGGTVTPTKLLKKVTIDDEGDIMTYNYTYNSDKKLTAVTTSDNSIKIDVTYLASGNIAKIVRTENFAGDISTEEIVPVYTSNQITKLNVTHTETGGSIKSIANLTYAANGWPSIVNEDVFGEDNTSVVANFVSNLSYSGNNVSRWNFKSKLNVGLPVPVFDFLQELELTVNLSAYDNKINPYNLLPKDYLISMIHAEADASSITGFAKNNAATINVIFNLGGTDMEDTQTATYVYDNDGYPTTVTATSIVTKFEYQ